MRIASVSWLVSVVEVSTFLWVVSGALTCLGGLLPVTHGGPVPWLFVGASATATALGGACGFVVRRRLVRRLCLQSRGFPVLPPR